MSKGRKKRHAPRRGFMTPAQEAGQCEALYALKYRLVMLLEVCHSVELRTADDMTVEVWGRLRAAPRRGLLRLAAVRHNLRAAVSQALAVAEELERPYRPVVSPELLKAIAMGLSDEDIRAAAAIFRGDASAT